ncbi:MFS transporter [Sphingomonas sp. MMS24-JH45]
MRTPPALPAIGSSLNTADANANQFVITAFFAGFGLEHLIHGPLADRYGRRRVLIVALVLYAIANALCAISSSFTLLLAARAFGGGYCGEPGGDGRPGARLFPRARDGAGDVDPGVHRLHDRARPRPRLRGRRAVVRRVAPTSFGPSRARRWRCSPGSPGGCPRRCVPRIGCRSLLAASLPAGAPR